MRSFVVCAALAGLTTSFPLLGEHEALACGGEFTPAPPPGQTVTVATDHHMILSVSTQQTTLWDEIDFAGAAASFAWVLPIKGTATVGLSSDLLFQSLDTLTATEVMQPQLNCPPPPPGCELNVDPTAGATGSAGGGGVTVLSQAQVGPYETVQLQSTDPNALAAWLAAHGYAVPAASSSVVAAYVQAGFNFLAMKLAPGQGVTTMRPVRVTTQGASPVLPLRMVAVGTGATTGITLWVIGDGRWEPQNFPFFVIKSSDLVWDWTTSSSNYDAVRTSKETALGGKGWQVESSLELAQTSVTGIVLTGSQFGAATQPATGAYLPVGAAAPADAGADAATGDAAAADAATGSADLARQQDLTTLFAGISGPNARITRMRSDIAHSALSADLTLQAASDQTELSNLYTPAAQTGKPPACPLYPECATTTTGSGPGSTGSGAGSKGSGTGSTGSGSARGATSTGGGGCSTSAAATPAGSVAAWAGLFGLFTLGAVRIRRRRR